MNTNSYSKTLKENYMELLQKEYDTFLEKLNNINQQNIDIRDMNSNIKKEIIEFLKDKLETSKQLRTKKKNYKWYDDLVRSCNDYYSPSSWQLYIVNGEQVKDVTKTEWFIQNKNIQDILQEEKIKNQNIEWQKKIWRAIEFLQKKWKSISLDFTILDCIEKANELRFQELIKERKENWYQEFNGRNCDDSIEYRDGYECKWWDWESHRCDCGNRRVYRKTDWDFEDMYIYAEAY